MQELWCWCVAMRTQENQPFAVSSLTNSLKGILSVFWKTFSTLFLVRCEKVGFLECDVGQPEFTVPMVTALHLVTTPVFGPAYLNHRKPYK